MALASHRSLAPFLYLPGTIDRFKTKVWHAFLDADQHLAKVYLHALIDRIIVEPGRARSSLAAGGGSRRGAERRRDERQRGRLGPRARVFATLMPVAEANRQAMLNELPPIGLTKNALRVAYAGKEIATEAWRFDVIEPRGAQVVGSITSLQEQYPIITSNRFGRGTAIYVGLPAQHGTLAPLVDDLIGRLGIRRGPATPEGVVARQVDDRHILYLNLTGESRVIRCPGKVRSVLDDSEHADSFTIGAFEPVFVETP